MEKILYQFWTGANEMTPNRVNGLKSSAENIRVPCKLVTRDNLADYLLPDHPLHECYEHLSDTHKADYLRCYFMHFHGGGYADIKSYGPENNFDAAFGMLESDPGIDIVGEPEIPGGAAFATYNADRRILGRLVSNGFYVCRKGTEFTSLWYGKMMRYMDVMRLQLRRHPATTPVGGAGYPIPWTYLLGVNFHHTCKEVTDRRPGAVSRALVSGWRRDVPYR